MQSEIEIVLKEMEDFKIFLDGIELRQPKYWTELHPDEHNLTAQEIESIQTTANMSLLRLEKTTQELFT